MITHQCDSNAILIAFFKLRKDSHRLLFYNKITTWIKTEVNSLISKAYTTKQYKKTMTEVCKVDYQLVPPNFHRRNAVKRAIFAFKVHFLAILAGIAEDFPKNMWDILIPQIEINLNLLIH